MNESEKNAIELDVAILGGGFAGVYCAKALSKQAEKLGLKVGIISKENHMVFQPMLAEVAGGSLSPRHVISPIRTLCKGVDVYKGDVKSVDLQAKTCVINAGHFSQEATIKFKHVVLALGAEIDLSRVPGMTEHALLMQGVGDALHLRQTAISRLEEANIESDPEIRKRLLSFVIVGGGYSGVETAGEIHDLLKEVCCYYSNVEERDIRVTLIHSKSHILNTLSEKLGSYAAYKLQERGVNIIFNTRVSSITASAVTLNDGRIIGSNTVVSTVGNSPNQVIQNAIKDYGLSSERGRINTTADLRVVDQTNIWAIGDNANNPMKGGGLCPETAQFASRMGELCGKNILKSIKSSKAKLQPFNFTGLGELASIGHQTAVAKVGGLQLSGFLAWFMWRTIYLSKLPGLERRLRVVIDWTLDLFFPRDINLLNTRYSQQVKKVHLGKGDKLFSAGDPSFSMYVVEKGCIVLKHPETGKVHNEFTQGDYFGERAIVHAINYRYDAIATEDTQLVMANGRTIMPVLQASRRFSRLIEKTTAGSSITEEMASMERQLDSTELDKPVEELMKTSVIGIPINTTFAEAIQHFKKQSYTIYPLFSKDSKKVVGFINRTDFFDYCKRPDFDMETETLKILKPYKMPTCTVGSSVRTAVRTMLGVGRYKCFILDEDGQMVGVLSMTDLFIEPNRHEYFSGV